MSRSVNGEISRSMIVGGCCRILLIVVGMRASQASSRPFDGHDRWVAVHATPERVAWIKSISRLLSPDRILKRLQPTPWPMYWRLA